MNASVIQNVSRARAFAGKAKLPDPEEFLSEEDLTNPEEEAESFPGAMHRIGQICEDRASQSGDPEDIQCAARSYQLGIRAGIRAGIRSGISLGQGQSHDQKSERQHGVAACAISLALLGEARERGVPLAASPRSPGVPRESHRIEKLFQAAAILGDPGQKAFARFRKEDRRPQQDPGRQAMSRQIMEEAAREMISYCRDPAILNELYLRIEEMIGQSGSSNEPGYSPGSAMRWKSLADQARRMVKGRHGSSAFVNPDRKWARLRSRENHSTLSTERKNTYAR